jgi:Dynamin family
MRKGAALFEEDFARLDEVLRRRFVGSGDRRLLRSIRALGALEAYLHRPLRAAVLGEQSSGKSSLINVLMRDNVVPAGALAGVRAHLLLRHGTEAALHAVAADGSRARLTSRALARMAGPEMRPSGPGTTIIYNASEPARRDGQRGAGLLQGSSRVPADGPARLIEIIQPHAFLRRAELVEARGWPEGAGKSVLRHALPVDLAVWCTLGTQAWKETERQSWQRFPAKLRKKAILLVTYKDAIGSAKDEAKLMSRMERDAGPIFSDIVLVSLRRAAEAIGARGDIADEAKWRKSGAAAFDTVMRARLDGLRGERQTRSLRLLSRLAAIAERSSASPAIVSPSAEETGKHFQGLIRHIEERHALGEAEPLVEVSARARGGKPPSVYGQETR